MTNSTYRRLRKLEEDCVHMEEVASEQPLSLHAQECPVGAENLCHQAIFMNHAPCAVTPLNPELIQVGDAIG